jgi:molybdate transport system substrate-binding protein
MTRLNQEELIMILLKKSALPLSIIFLWILFFNFGYITPVKAQSPGKVMVFAAASTTNAITKIGELFSKETHYKFVASFASSSTLAKQIDRGAPANVYISANPKWMTFIDDKGLIEKTSRCDILGNRIIFIAPKGSDLKIDIHPGFKLPAILSTEKIAMGDPEHVPAGIYGKQALTFLGAWDEIAPKIVRAKDVRTALVFVERGEAPLGIVYATDAAITDKVRVVGIFPENSHPPITYQAAIIKENQTKAAQVFLAFLKSPGAKAIFQSYGFSTL